MRLRRLVIGIAALGIAACGGGNSPSVPTTPTPTTFAQLSGGWTGNVAFTQPSGNASLAVNLVLSQAGGTVTGTWAAGSANWNGTITGTVDSANFAGVFTVSLPNALGTGVCTGSASVSGPATGATLKWTGAGFAGSTCNGMPTSLTWNLLRP